MDLSQFTKQILLGLSSVCLMGTIEAKTPLWSFTSDGSQVVDLMPTQKKDVTYTVTNNSYKQHELVLSSKTPAGISQTGGPCSLAGKGSTCTLTLTIDASLLPSNTIIGGPSLCQTNSNGTPNLNQCYKPNRDDILVITRAIGAGLDVSVKELALSVKNKNINPALTGNPRYITITNKGYDPTDTLTITAEHLPSDTLFKPNCPTTLNPQKSCYIVIQPGRDASQNKLKEPCSKGVAPRPGIITVTANNAQPVTTSIYVLSYGCIYQGGFLYSVDDTTDNGKTGTCTTPPCMGSIGGKVLALTDQKLPFPNGIAWDADPACTPPNKCTQQTNAWDFYHGENLKSVPGSTNPMNTGTNGPGNTYQIVSILNGQNGNSDNPANYAAAVCTKYTDGVYADWYLPALCEMGYGSDTTSPCGTSNAPKIQNIQSSLIDSSGLSSPKGGYWSSTEDPDSLRYYYAWYQIFSKTSLGDQGITLKYLLSGVRCSRALTP